MSATMPDTYVADDPAGDFPLVQLLTPEGERVPHPDFSYDGDDDSIRDLYPRSGPEPAHRLRGARPAAPRRARPLGAGPGPGSRPDRLGPRAPPAGLRLPDLSRARRRAVPRRRPRAAPRPVPRRRARRLGSGRARLRALQHRHRRPDPARHRLCDGPDARRRGRPQRSRARRRRHRLLRRRRDEPGRRQRGVRLGCGLQRAGRVLLPEQPVRHLGLDRPQHPRTDRPACRRLRLQRHPRRRQ